MLPRLCSLHTQLGRSLGLRPLTCILARPSFCALSPRDVPSPLWTTGVLSQTFGGPVLVSLSLIYFLPMHCVVLLHNWGGLGARWQEKKRKKNKWDSPKFLELRGHFSWFSRELVFLWVLRSREPGHGCSFMTGRWFGANQGEK